MSRPIKLYEHDAETLQRFVDAKLYLAKLIETRVTIRFLQQYLDLPVHRVREFMADRPVQHYSAEFAQAVLDIPLSKARQTATTQGRADEVRLSQATALRDQARELAEMLPLIREQEAERSIRSGEEIVETGVAAPVSLVSSDSPKRRSLLLPSGSTSAGSSAAVRFERRSAVFFDPNHLVPDIQGVEPLPVLTKSESLTTLAHILAPVKIVLQQRYGVDLRGCFRRFRDDELADETEQDVVLVAALRRELGMPVVHCAHCRDAVVAQGRTTYCDDCAFYQHEVFMAKIQNAKADDRTECKHCGASLGRRRVLCYRCAFEDFMDKCEKQRQAGLEVL